MAREILTPELAEAIRLIRLRNKVTSKELASHINKSPAYVTKLEKGSFNTLDTDELLTLLKFITKERDDYSTINYVYHILESQYTNGEIEDQLWFYNYDTVIRKLFIPHGLIDYINQFLIENSITRKYLCYRINSNEALPQEDVIDNNIPLNHWYCKVERDKRTYIKIYISEEEIYSILDRKITYSSYIYIFCICYYALKIRKYKDAKKINDENDSELKKEVKSIFRNYEFFSTTGKYEFKSENRRINNLVSTFDSDFSSSISKILEKMVAASNNNSIKTDEQLVSFSENLSWDLGFMMRLIGMDFASLEKTSVCNRKKFISEIEKLIEKYGHLEDDKNIEDYG